MNTLGSFVISPNQLAITLEGTTLAELDGALADLSANTLLVAQRRNKHILATHTNQDVLEIIFSAVIDRQGSAGLRFVSQVCREWRRVALGAPLLWRKALSLSVNRNWMFEMVRRTMQVPLTIHVSHQGFQGGVVYTNLLSIADQFWRFETLEFDAPYPYICEFFGLVPFDGNEAPHLRVLSLCGQNWQGFPSDEILPDELLTLSTPNLERLAVENFPFGWNALTSGLARSIKLSVLHICYHGESEAPHTLSISELLATLACMTSLRELKLRNVLKATDGNLFMEWNTPATVLPALQILDLQANIQFCSGFLNGVEAPVLVELDVECNTTDETSNAHQFMTSPFMIGVSRTAPHNPYDILAAICNKGELWVSLRSSRTGAFCRILLPQANNDLVLECVLRQLADMPSVRNTKSLEISLSKDAHNKVAEEAWSYLLERLNSVSSLNLGRYPVPCILRNLYRNAKGALDAQRQGGEVSVLLPFLETITVAASSKLCVLVDMIAELREPVGAPIDRYVILRGTDTYHALREHVTTWLEGGDPSVQIEDDEENAEESD
ncbi:hypothetical protein PISMIDRAFT_8549 [Pisolithus microcarpus 441]|uniref:Unplaced genomic scaffold scaffold_14, whole genome shotgun sequence n=1 Tax=Pisolithus microcarpus 441 TaxID=765257 RepID=A0A0C9ZXW4_9AGAM|nr:hypothetical protein PISMIDRAFT_8549 [Pisolithus microcarpus 441]